MKAEQVLAGKSILYLGPLWPEASLAPRLVYTKLGSMLAQSEFIWPNLSRQFSSIQLGKDLVGPMSTVYIFPRANSQPCAISYSLSLVQQVSKASTKEKERNWPK